MQQETVVSDVGEADGVKVGDRDVREKYLTFRLAGETYGIEVLKVREIIGVIKITRIPRIPEYIRGVINLRGKVLPVMDLRMRFGMGNTEISEHACIVVIDPSGASDRMMGALVDAVSDVTDIEDKDTESVHELGESVQTRFIRGIGKTRDRVVLLLDVEEIIDSAKIDDSLEN